MNTVSHSILVLSLAAFAIGCQKGGDAVETTSSPPPSAPSAPSAGQSAGGTAGENSEETLPMEIYVKARLKILCASEKLGSQVEHADIRARVLETMEIPDEMYRQADETFGDTDGLETAIDKRMAKRCTAERARRALEVDGESQ